jgi:hypothetical protein
VYSAIVPAVTAAKSQPNFHVRMAHTIVISSAVGMTWKTIDERMNEIPLGKVSVKVDCPGAACVI